MARKTRSSLLASRDRLRRFLTPVGTAEGALDEEDERDVEYGSWSKGELFRMEKSVLTFGYVVFSRFFYDTFSKELLGGKVLHIVVVCA